MLALSRKIGESIMINNNIQVTILEVHGDQVKLGIAAPREVSVYRQEIYDQIQQENKSALDVASLDMLKNLL